MFTKIEPSGLTFRHIVAYYKVSETEGHYVRITEPATDIKDARQKAKRILIDSPEATVSIFKIVELRAEMRYGDKNEA